MEYTEYKNDVMIDGEADEIDRFFKTVGKCFDFNTLIPMPKILRHGFLRRASSGECRPEDVEARFIYKDGELERPATPAELQQLKDLGYSPGMCGASRLHWTLENWGCHYTHYGDDPCEAEPVHYGDGKAYVEYAFDTEPFPPTKIYLAIRKQFPRLEIVWDWEATVYGTITSHLTGE